MTLSFSLPYWHDLHTHLREPGKEEAETIETGSRAAALGGYTAVVAMPNTDPTQDCVSVVDFVRRQGLAAGLCDVYPSGSITVGRHGTQLTPFAELAEALDQYAADPQRTIRQLVRVMVLHFCVGNTNAHANTYSLLHPELELGPVQTLLPAEIYTELITDDGTFDIDHRLAMGIGGQMTSAEVTRGAVIAEAASWPRLSRTSAELEVDAAVDAIGAALRSSVAVTSAVPEGLPAMIAERLERLRP